MRSSLVLFVLETRRLTGAAVSSPIRAVADRSVSAGLRSLYKRIRLSRRGFRSCPLPGPVAVPQHLVAGMDGEFDEHRPLRNTEHLGTDVDDTPAEFETEVEQAAMSNLDKHHRD